MAGDFFQKTLAKFETVMVRNIADRGYYKGEEILFCEQSGITTFIPKTHTSMNEKAGLFRRESFHYHPTIDEYTCPAGEHLIWRFQSVEGGKVLDTYWSSACRACSMKERCTKGKQRRIRCWNHEDVLDTVQQRLEQTPDSMRIRRETVEHPFGTINAWMGYTHFLTKRLPKVRTEMSLLVLAYNLKRVINLIGVQELLALLTICLILSVRYQFHMHSSQPCNKSINGSLCPTIGFDNESCMTSLVEGGKSKQKRLNPLIFTQPQPN